MEDEAKKENGKLDQILESLDLFFSRLTDVGIQQKHIKEQIERKSSLVA
jgi:hypothetical protein